MTELTIFTPAYNRKELLKRLYRSLQRQTDKSFIWMVIDDGSTDDTRKEVSEWATEEKDFQILYYYKKNGGLHTAYNEAIAHIETPLCVCIDSDDWMPDEAVEKILNFWTENGSDRVAGIVGLDCYEDGQAIGDPLPNQKTVNLIDLLTGKAGIKNGDRTNVVRTELYKQVAPMKVFPGEKNFNPHYMHLQISQNYDFLVLNECLRIVEYQPEGMSNSMLKQYRNSPNSFAEIRKLYLSFPGTSFKFRAKHSIHLTSSCILAGKVKESFASNPYKGIAIMTFPLGWLLSLFVRLKVSEK